MIDPIAAEQMGADYKAASPRLGAFAHPKAKQIIERFSADRGIPYSALAGPKRTRNIAWPRQELFLELREQTGLNYSAIGRRFNRDHTTVRHGIAAAKARREANT